MRLIGLERNVMPRRNALVSVGIIESLVALVSIKHVRCYQAEVNYGARWCSEIGDSLGTEV